MGGDQSDDERDLVISRQPRADHTVLELLPNAIAVDGRGVCISCMVGYRHGRPLWRWQMNQSPVLSPRRGIVVLDHLRRFTGMPIFGYDDLRIGPYEGEQCVSGRI